MGERGLVALSKVSAKTKEQYLKKLPILSLSAEMNEEVRNASLLWGTVEHQVAIRTFINKE